MRIAPDAFLEKYRQLFLARTPGIGVFAYWKMKYLIETGECYHLPEHDCLYVIRNRHLLVYYAPDGRMHIPAQALNALDCISLPAALYDSIQGQLSGFEAKYDWSLRYDFSYRPKERAAPRYEAVDFDFNNPAHYRKAAKIINNGSRWLRAGNIKKVAANMASLSAFDPALWFFVRKKGSRTLAAVSISACCAAVRQTDLDYIFVAPKAQGKGCGRFLLEETMRRCAGKSGYRFAAQGIQP